MEECPIRLFEVLNLAKGKNATVCIGMKHPNPNQDPPYGHVCCWSSDDDGLIHLVDNSSKKQRDFYVLLSTIAWVEVAGE